MKPFKNDLEFTSILSEFRIALKFVSDNCDYIRYCINNKKWYIFDGNRWLEDFDNLKSRELLILTIKQYFDYYMSRCVEEKQRIKLVIFNNKCLRSNSLKQILSDASLIADIQILKEKFDQHLTLLVTPSGTVDLSTGELRHSKPGDFMTKIAATAYHPALDFEKECPRFLKFLKEVTCDDQELFNHILRILSYCLTGSTSEQKLYLFLGAGANGKSVLLEVIRAILGNELVIHVDSKTLVQNQRIIREDVARFDGVRMATCSEIGRCDTFDEPLVKGLAGGDQQVSRKLRENSVEFVNRAKIIIATNYLPDLEGTDYGIARRLEVIPFMRSFAENPDPELKNKLLQEREGILALLIKHAPEVIANGIGTPPNIVKEKTDNYINFGNSVKCFFNDCCSFTNDSKKESNLRTVFDSYKEFCKRNSMDEVSRRDFTRLLEMMGQHQRKSGSQRYWAGFKVDIDKDGNTKNTPFATNVIEKEEEMPLQSSDLSSTKEALGNLETPDNQDQLSQENV